MIFNPISLASFKTAFVPQTNNQTGFNMNFGSLGPVLQNVGQTGNNIAAINQLGL